LDRSRRDDAGRGRRVAVGRGASSVGRGEAPEALAVESISYSTGLSNLSHVVGWVIASEY